MTYMTYDTFRGLVVPSDTPTERLAAVKFSNQVVRNDSGRMGPYYAIPGALRFAGSNSRTFRYPDADTVEDLDFLADEGMANLIAAAPGHLRALLDGDRSSADQVRALLDDAPEYTPSDLSVTWDGNMLVDFSLPDVLRGRWSGPLSFGRDLHMAVFVAYARHDLTRLLGD